MLLTGVADGRVPMGATATPPLFPAAASPRAGELPTGDEALLGRAACDDMLPTGCGLAELSGTSALVGVAMASDEESVTTEAEPTSVAVEGLAEGTEAGAMRASNGVMGEELRRLEGPARVGAPVRTAPISST